MIEVNGENISEEEFVKNIKEWMQTPNWLNETIEYMNKNWEAPE